MVKMIKTCRKGLHRYDGQRFNRCVECHRDADRIWYEANRDQRKKDMLANKDLNKERYNATTRAWRKVNRGKCNAITRKYEAAKLQRTPKWLTKEQLQEMEEFYVQAKELQWLSDPTDPLEVDHIIPLQGDEVSGLHVPWNLQILPESSNRRKGNSLV